MIIAILFLILATLIFPGLMRLLATLLLFAFLFMIAGARDQARADSIYLDKLDPGLDDRWNALDDACRSEPGGSEASDLACDQRLALDKILEKKGCRNIYSATGPNDTSYWKCRR